MMERSIHAVNVPTGQLKKLVSLDTNKEYMQESSIHAGNVNIKQLKRVLQLNTRELYMQGM